MKWKVAYRSATEYTLIHEENMTTSEDEVVLDCPESRQRELCTVCVLKVVLNFKRERNASLRIVCVIG